MMMMTSNCIMKILGTLVTLCLLTDASKLVDHLSLVYKDTYVVYGAGRRSERDLPVCESTYEACNLAHHRPWLLPITERFCRCPRGTDCPLNFVEDHPSNSQHISNRGQLRFCDDLDSSFETCSKSGPALEVHQEKVLDNTIEEDYITRTSLFCKCPWPNAFVLNKTTEVNPNIKIRIYFCEELPHCNTDETCGHVRKDTYEVYYTCSCPTNHICTFKEPYTYSTDAVNQLELLHFKGESYVAVCTSK